MFAEFGWLFLILLILSLIGHVIRAIQVYDLKEDRSRFREMYHRSQIDGVRAAELTAQLRGQITTIKARANTFAKELSDQY